MNHYLEYKKRNDLEKKILKYDDSDLKDILIRNKNLIKEFSSLSSSEIDKKIKNINNTTITNLLINNIDISEINSELDKINKYEIKDIVKENFPLDEPRELQLETISKIYDAIEKGYKYIILEAVSGYGKSLIAATLSNIYSEEKSYFLTTTNQLANQYFYDFKKYDFVKMNPRSSFSCKKTPMKCSAYLCKYSKCRYYKYSDFNKDFDKPLSCEYLYSLKEILKSNSIICTYDFFINENFYHSNYFNTRKLLICDEAHNLDEKISESISLKINPKQFTEDMKLNIKKELQHINQNNDYYFYLLKFRTNYKNRLNNVKKGSALYIKLKKRIDDISKFMDNFKNNENMTFEVDSDNYWIFKPLKINKMADDSLLSYGDVSIFMSSSIFDLENFAFDLGIDKNKIYSIRVPNIFDLSKHKVEISPNFDMSGEPIETGTAEDCLPTIKKILKKHKHEKGVIHTFNYEQMKYIVSNIKNNRFITHDSENREKILENFKTSDKPLVLVSPSMNEGIDIPGDLCRFQIIFKLPYLPYENTWINKRKNLYEDGKEWYDYKMLTKLIQSYGRGIRFEEDYCKTYILDNRLFDKINEDLEDKEIIPKYFINSIENLNQNIE
ncbi:helicase C-terminal domain-containing protein [Methanobrevibacter millerae]|uniref:ATP-dependent DNA helicase n=1 Tax=Methanobrevibacter millerae TaxID=230361 RepID=A0A0U2V3D7_9EURY|nr:helicase C-terminal domain-containing protein [Methanobrevibacter millerae]ALT68978.1 ATP-dependent DNA helicase [Methanobrevibacter millerae]